MTPAERFFYYNAGYSYDPKTETSKTGRTRCAAKLAAAEARASAEGFSFGWEHESEIDSSDFSDEQPPYRLWVCWMRNPAGGVVGSLGAVDFGRDEQPWGNNYRRVVEAELASEHFGG